MGKPIKRIFSFFEEGEGESEGLSLSRSNILALKESGSIPNWLIIQKLEGRGGKGGSLSITNNLALLGLWQHSKLVNPLTAISHLHLIYLYDITPESHIKVMRIKEMIIN